MISKIDIYRYSETIEVIAGPQGTTPTASIGTIYAEYEVQEYIDVQNLTSQRTYIVTAKQRLVVPNPTGIQNLSTHNLTSYQNYPILLVSSMTINALPSACSIELLDYSPKTVNTTVSKSTANSVASGSSTSTSTEQTNGNSNSDTNSYELNASVGAFGYIPMGSIGGSGGHSNTTSSFSQFSTGIGKVVDSQSSASASNSMSIKDWASYASVPVPKSPSWVWAQEFPWDIVEFHNIVSGETVTLPDFVQGALVDQTSGVVYPPSQLSLFGVNFLATAKWKVQVPNSYDGSNETFTVTHAVNCTQASHSVGTPVGEPPLYPAIASIRTLTPFTSTPSTQIDMVQLGLDPITEEGTSNGAVVGFVMSQFIALAPKPTYPFRITSNGNNILVLGTGFTTPTNNDSPMTANLINGSVTFQVYFKIVDPLVNLMLYLKHWISSTDSLCFISVTINGLKTIDRHIDSMENGSGSDNVTTITLRNQDFSSPDFYDYLVLGMNVIEITVSASHDPTGAAVPGVYSLRALAIG